MSSKLGKIFKTRKKALNEMKISVEIEPKDLANAQQEFSVPKSSSGYGGKFESYVREISCTQSLYESLVETSRELNKSVESIIEDVALREDKVKYNAAERIASEKVSRSWRSFLRELAEFEAKFK